MNFPLLPDMMRAAALILMAAAFPAAWAQEDTVSPQDVMIIFAIFIASVIALFLYLARDIILRRRTEYDRSEYESKKNRDYEKYHSDWLDDYEEFSKGTQAGGPDYYGVLGVPPDADIKIIKARYRQLAKMHHPDVSGEGSSEMTRINEAYETLSDSRRRAEYDRRLDNGARGGI